VRRLETPQYQFALKDEAHLRGLFERVLRAPRGQAQDSHVLALREGVCAFVQRAKADGRHVETIIIALKDIFGIPDRPNRVVFDDDDIPPAVLLARRIVRWCIKEYYGPESGGPLSEG
jgi:hypothetical protein